MSGKKQQPFQINHLSGRNSHVLACAPPSEMLRDVNIIRQKDGVAGLNDKKLLKAVCLAMADDEIVDFSVVSYVM